MNTLSWLSNLKSSEYKLEILYRKYLTYAGTNSSISLTTDALNSNYFLGK